jgi:hypothetical protein
MATTWPSSSIITASRVERILFARIGFAAVFIVLSYMPSKRRKFLQNRWRPAISRGEFPGNNDSTQGMSMKMPASFNGFSFAPFCIALSLFCARALGCECVAPPPPCEAVGQSDLVFLGTVTEVITQPGSFFKTARMNVDDTFKGSLNKTVDLFDDGICDGPDLQPGKQYLMYTSGFPGGGIPARGCTRSRRIEDADEDLRFLRQYKTGNVATQISGTVRFRPDEPEDSKLGDAGRVPLGDVRVTLSGDGIQLGATTTPLGRYSFSNIAPGEYTVDAQLAGYRIIFAQPPFKLGVNGCLEANLLMKIDRRVAGKVLDSSGSPVKGALIEMVSTDPKLKRWEKPVLLDESHEKGHYAMDGVPPGEYYLGVNIGSTPTKEYPYPTVYYPNTLDPLAAVPIRVTAGPSVQEFDLRVARKLPLVTIRGIVQMADGKPPLPQDRPQVRIKEPGLYGQIEQETIAIAADGRFEFELCEGIEYSAFAFAGPARSAIYSAPVEFTPTKANDRLVLTLDKSLDEFNKLRPR